MKSTYLFRNQFKKTNKETGFTETYIICMNDLNNLKFMKARLETVRLSTFTDLLFSYISNVIFNLYLIISVALPIINLISTNKAPVAKNK